MIKVECHDFFINSLLRSLLNFSLTIFYIICFVLQVEELKMVENGREEELVVESHVGWEELGRSGLSPSEQAGMLIISMPLVLNTIHFGKQ